LFVRVSEYGITVDRVFGIIVALASTAYAVGYTIAAFRRGPWLQGIERVNVAMAIGIIIVLALTLSPIASPYRLSASSQHARALSTEGLERESALRYLRFEAGAYGQRALDRLAKLQGEEKRDKELRQAAQRMLEQEHPWGRSGKIDAQVALENLTVYPSGRQLDDALIEAMREDPGSLPMAFADASDQKPAALLIDMNGDAVEEVILMIYPYLTLYALRNDRWKRLSDRFPATGLGGQHELHEALAAGDFAALAPQWNDLRVGKRRFRLTTDELAPDLSISPRR
jgi:hypothetical protein